MNRIVWFFCILLSYTQICFADKEIRVSDSIFLVESQNIGSITTSSIHSTASTEPNLKCVFASIEGGNVRFWADGTTPATNTGHLLASGDYVLIQGINNCLNFKFVAENTATVRLSYGR